MKTSDKLTQILNVRSTISQLQRHELRQPIYQVCQIKSMCAKEHQARQPKHQIHQTKNQIHQTKRPSTPKYTKYAKYTKPNTKYAKQKTKYVKQKACLQSKTQSTPKKTPNTPKNTNYVKKQQICQPKPVFIILQLKYKNVNLYSKIFIYTVLSQKKFCSKFTHFLVYFLQA